jgi:hypothetical protein
MWQDVFSAICASGSPSIDYARRNIALTLKIEGKTLKNNLSALKHDAWGLKRGRPVLNFSHPAMSDAMNA